MIIFNVMDFCKVVLFPYNIRFYFEVFINYSLAKLLSLMAMVLYCSFLMIILCMRKLNPLVLHHYNYEPVNNHNEYTPQ